MNTTKIDWTEMSWNPITGCNGPDGTPCPYCYARKIARRFYSWRDADFKPTFHPDRLAAPLKRKKPTRIFLGSMTDMFGVGVDHEWVAEVLNIVKQCPQHTFMVLTKRPDRIAPLLRAAGVTDPIQNIWLGTSVEAQDAAHRIRTLVNLPGDWTKFISFEPLLGEVKADLSEINWIIIGARTNPTRLPDNNWVQGLILEALQDDVPIFLKDSIQSYWPEQWRQIPGGPQQ